MSRRREPGNYMDLTPDQNKLLHQISDVIDLFIEQHNGRAPDRVVLGRVEWGTLIGNESSDNDMFVLSVPVEVEPRYWSMIAPVLERQP